jgi:hypothetical protein
MSPLDQLCERAVLALRASAGERPLSVFIDPTLADLLGETYRANLQTPSAPDWGRARVVKLAPIHADFGRERTPYLLHLPSEALGEHVTSAALRVALAEALGEYGPHYTARSVCGFILGDDDPEQTAYVLARLAHVIRPNYRPWYLRYWDPRVLWHLPRVLPSALWQRIAAALGGRWYVVDALNYAFARVPPADPGYLGDDLSQVPCLTDETWLRLQLIGSNNRMLAIARDWGLEPTPVAAQRTETLLLQARTMGFSPEDEGIVFAAAGLTSHDLFYLHPRVAELLRAAAQHKTPLSEALAHLDPNFWVDVSTGRWLEAH